MKKSNDLKIQYTCLECDLRTDSFFCHFSHQDLRELESLKVTHFYPKRETIFMEGQVVKGVYILCQGLVKLSTCSQDGKVIILNIARPGEVLGLSATIADSYHITSAETLEPSQINFISKKDFMDFIGQKSQAALSALNQMSRNYRATCLHTCSLGLSASVADKLATLLISWCKHIGNGNGNGFRVGGNGTYQLEVNYTHEEIAQMIGTSRETVTRILRDFSDRQLLIKEGSRITIPNIKHLESAIGTRMGGTY